MKEMLATHRQPLDLPQSNYIVELLTVVLTNNFFEFNGAHHHQVSSTDLATKLTPSYVNLLMLKFELSINIHILYNLNYGTGLLMTSF